MVCYYTGIFMIAIVTGKCTVLLLNKYSLKVCAVWFGFWSSCLKFCIYLRCINTQRRTTTTPFSLWLPSPQSSLLCWYYKNYGFQVCVILFDFIQLIILFVFIYHESAHSCKQQHQLTSLNSYHLATTEHRDCMMGQPIVVKEIVTSIHFVCFSHLRQFTNVTNQC